MTTQIRRERPEDMPGVLPRRPRDRGRTTTTGSSATTTPTTKQFQLIDTCYGTHHLQFDEKGRLWVSGDSFVLGWFDPDKYDPARPETLEQAQGWSRDEGQQRRRRRRRTRRRPASTTGSSRTTVDGSVWTGRLRRRTTRGHPALRPGDRQARGLPPAGARARARAAWTSTPRASSGPAWAAAATWPSSTAPSAPAPGATATSAPRAGRSTEPRPDDRHRRRPRERDQRRLPLLPVGQPVQHARHGQGHGDPQRHRLRLAAGLRPEDREVHGHPGARTRRTSSRGGSTGASTTPRPAGRAAGCGSTTAPTRCSTPRSSSRTSARCSSGRTRWPGRADVTPPLRRGAGAEGWRTRGSSMPPRTG